MVQAQLYNIYYLNALNIFVFAGIGLPPHDVKRPNYHLYWTHDARSISISFNLKRLDQTKITKKLVYLILDS